MATLNGRGHEVLSSIKKAVKLPFKKPKTVHERIREMIIAEIARERAEDEETFEDADDFDIGDDFDPRSPYEEDFDHLDYSPKAKKKKAVKTDSKPTSTPAETPSENSSDRKEESSSS